MVSIAIAVPATAPELVSSRTRRFTPWHLGLGVLAALSGLVYLWGLQLGERSEYYASIALSMSTSWSNFFFGAFDPAGSVSLDKIPGSFWVPALFVRAFGFSTWSVDAPNAIASVVAVVLVAITARRLLNPTAGVIAGAVVATTPVLAAVGRSNQPESFFVLALALVAWSATKAVQSGSFRWLMISGACVAVAFQTYMLEAWAVWPALALAYLFVRKPMLRKIVDVLIAGLSSLALSLLWIIIVFLTPAASRPYVGGTYTNNPFEMVFGYNGLGRFSATSSSSDYRSFTPPFSGSAGVFRLANEQLAGQVAWLLPAALVALIVLVSLRFSRAVTVFLGGWLVTMLVMFSTVAGMHQFYTAALAIPVGLLVATAFARARALRVLWPQLVLIGVAALTAGATALLYPRYFAWVAAVQIGLAVAVCILLVVDRRGGHVGARWWVTVAVAASLVLTPAAWTVDTINHPNSTNPVAGDGSAVFPTAGGGFRAALGAPPSRADGGKAGSRPQGAGPGGAQFGATQLNSAVLAYVTANRGAAEYLLATFGAQQAASYITATDGQAVLPIGGFDGSDPTPTLDQFRELVSSGRLTYVLVGAGGGAARFSSTTATSEETSTQIRTWVVNSCTPVTDGAVSGAGLYRCDG
ncbi:4-amino-4-deoxy-L-arabinose transferase [Agreia sp. COWG]|nr:4-amino-4-deoxy-L-arabinose transferase [Agreia sp. COWG]